MKPLSAACQSIASILRDCIVCAFQHLHRPVAQAALLASTSRVKRRTPNQPCREVDQVEGNHRASERPESAARSCSAPRSSVLKSLGNMGDRAAVPRRSGWLASVSWPPCCGACSSASRHYQFHQFQARPRLAPHLPASVSYTATSPLMKAARFWLAGNGFKRMHQRANILLPAEPRRQCFAARQPCH